MGTKVLMVCLGNICRSPLAEGILKSKLDRDTIQVDSAGTASYHIGKKPDNRSISIAKKYGIDISQQQCRQFTTKDFNEYDLIYAMDNSNYENIVALAGNKNDIAKVNLLLHRANLTNKEVPDPYFGDENGFEEIFHLIDSACNLIVQDIIHK
ncbi:MULTISPECIES: low molecular weight protein-tyrosine-phosphatase [unclassified Arenibacter]|jgi:protein-tyrosine phosphatase|uniref:low molecular weight protein-tyrosine-phosphatase n=1 Tax=unclassified Arenibacter TaxID=2615047 RepID=UPI000E349030|nr:MULTISPECIES: low molecular weight protein-tyrosine-phosphatase [unclassified Arenibacter]MCM4163528.1 protein-tyrosine-phosphatase [Arenibacter sp. A80]RFT57518.1 low molecular weight phosphotyrosine protein phosphatase [Arenibacter sp. P308M17]